MTIFDNPNSPQQPQAGVYKWYVVLPKSKLVLYVGSSGNRAPKKGVLRFSKPCTLFRGAAQARQLGSYPSSTNVIVGAAIQYLNSVGLDCHWKHIDNNPKHELSLVGRLNPILQDVHGHLVVKDQSHVPGWLAPRMHLPPPKASPPKP